MTTQVRKNVMDMFIDGARREFTHRHDQPVTQCGHGICHYSGAENYRSARLGRPYLPARDGVVGLPAKRLRCFWLR